MTIAIGAPFRVLVVSLVVALGATACMGTSVSDATGASPSSCDEAVSVEPVDANRRRARPGWQSD